VNLFDRKLRQTVKSDRLLAIASKLDVRSHHWHLLEIPTVGLPVVAYQDRPAAHHSAMGGADEIATARPFLAKDGDYQLAIERMNITDLDGVQFAVVTVGETVDPPLLNGLALAHRKRLDGCIEPPSLSGISGLSRISRVRNEKLHGSPMGWERPITHPYPAIDKISLNGRKPDRRRQRPLSRRHHGRRACSSSVVRPGSAG